MKLKNLFFIFALTGAILFAGFRQATAQKVEDETANFTTVVENRLKTVYKTTLAKICPVEADATARRIFGEYGAIFVAGDGVILPGKCIFSIDSELQNYQTQAVPQTENIGGTSVTLQKPAMAALLRARSAAQKKNLSITPRGGSLASTRTLQNTVDLWNSRFFPALNYWTTRRKISAADAAATRNLPIDRQVAQVLAWESKGLYFSKDLSKSILYSVAAPGASQHNFMLALDVQQFADKRVRQILADNGWFQTVQSDLPHFTYLGVKEADLPALGLKAVTVGGQKFWIPNLEP